MPWLTSGGGLATVHGRGLPREADGGGPRKEAELGGVTSAIWICAICRSLCTSWGSKNHHHLSDP